MLHRQEVPFLHQNLFIRFSRVFSQSKIDHAITEILELGPNYNRIKFNELWEGFTDLVSKSKNPKIDSQNLCLLRKFLREHGLLQKIVFVAELKVRLCPHKFEAQERLRKIYTEMGCDADSAEEFIIVAQKATQKNTKKKGLS